MLCTLSELCTREILNVSDGRRLGELRDLIVDGETGRLLAMLVPEKQKLFRLFHPREDIRIPWGAVKKLGPEVILVEIPGEYERERRFSRF